MTRINIGKPPQGLKDEELHQWYVDQFEDAYEKRLFDHREARRKAEARVEEVEGELTELKKKIPEEGDVLLKGKDVEKWNELKEVDLEQLRQQAQEGERVKRQDFLRTVAESVGYKPKTFAELVELKGVEVVAEEADGKTAYKVKTKDAEGKETTVPLGDHFKNEYADWLPALTPSDSEGTPERPTNRSTTLGRLPTEPATRRDSDDPQQRVLQAARERASRSRNVALQGFEQGSEGGGSG